MFHFYFLLSSMVVAIPTPVDIHCDYCHNPRRFEEVSDYIHHWEREPLGYYSLKYTS